MIQTKLKYLVAAVTLVITLQSIAAEKTEFIIAGSGSNIPITKILVEEFLAKNPGVPIKVLPSIGSTGGIKAVHQGKIDLAIISRPLRTAEKNWNLTITPYAKSMLVFAVNSSVLEESVTPTEAIQIYDGKKTKWSNGNSIIVVIREEGDSGAELLVSLVPALKDIFVRAWQSGIWRIEYREQEATDAIERTKDTFGWTDYTLVKIAGSKVKILRYNDITPSEENVQNGKYPLIRELSFVSSDALPTRLLDFIKFAKSNEGALIMRKYGTIPTK